MGLFRAAFAAVDQLEDTVIAAQGYEREKKSFEDQVRAALETLDVADEE